MLTDVGTNPGETINLANNPSYATIKDDLKKELMANLSKRGLTPLPENRTIKAIRAAEEAGNQKKKAKG
jgi:hypothetical protein